MRALPKLSATLCLVATLHPAVAAPPDPANTSPMLEIDVISKRLDEARQEIQPNLGATAYHFSPDALQNIPQGQNAPVEPSAAASARRGAGQLRPDPFAR